MHDTEMTKIHQEKILVGYNEGLTPPARFLSCMRNVENTHNFLHTQAKAPCLSPLLP